MPSSFSLRVVNLYKAEIRFDEIFFLFFPFFLEMDIKDEKIFIGFRAGAAAFEARFSFFFYSSVYFQRIIGLLKCFGSFSREAFLVALHTHGMIDLEKALFILGS